MICFRIETKEGTRSLNADVSSMIRADSRPKQAPITLGSDQIEERENVRKLG